MTDAQIILQGVIKMMKFFPLLVPTIVLGLAVLAVDERREVNERTKRKVRTYTTEF